MVQNILTPHRGRILSFASDVEPDVIEQASRIAELPFVSPYVALMPDAHLGKGSSVGTVIPTVDAVIPAAVGVDIGCGMIGVRTRLTWGDIEHLYGDVPGHNLAELRSSVESAIPMSKGGYNRKTDRFAFTQARVDELIRQAEKDGVDLSHSPNWPLQLGTLGGGNHFIELCVDEEEHVWLFLHSGSRGVGNKIAQRHIKTAQALMKRWWIELPDLDLAYLPQGTPEFSTYIKELNWAQRFAYENRAEMMDRFLQAFIHWMGLKSALASDDPLASWRESFEQERINTHHNYTKRTKINGNDVWLTRKGAVDASEGVMGLIPGSMGTASYVVRGRGNQTGLLSAPHGAGRRFSRTEARRRFTVEDLADRMDGIEYRHGDAWVDEIPDAYKDIDVVMRDAEPLVEVVHKLRQVMNVKGE